MRLQAVIERAAATAQAKGFRTDQHATQVAMVATEIAEALAHVTMPPEFEARMFVGCLIHQVTRFEEFRRQAVAYDDYSVVRDQAALLEELADALLRICSYVGGNGQGEAFLAALAAKMDVNEGRDVLHGKGF